MIRRFYRVSDNLFRGGEPSVDDIYKLKNNFNIKKIVSLDENIGKNIDRVCSLLGIEHIIIPIDVTNKSSILNLLKYDIMQLIESNSPTFIHCYQGKDRTGLVVAMFKCKSPEFEWTCDKALEEAESFGFGTGLNKDIINLYTKLICKSCNHDHDHIIPLKEDVNDLDVPIVGLTNNPSGLKGNIGIVENDGGFIDEGFLNE